MAPVLSSSAIISRIRASKKPDRNPAELQAERSQQATHLILRVQHFGQHRLALGEQRAQRLRALRL